MNELRIKELVASQGHTMQWLAKQMNITPSSLSHILQRDELSAGTLRRLAVALGCDIPDLFASSKTTITCPHCGKVITIKTE